MMGKNGLWLILLAFLCLFAALAPNYAYAQQSDCDGSKSQIDTMVTAHRQGYAQQLFTHSQNINSLFPVLQALDACVTNLMKIFSLLPTLANPLNIVAAIVIGLVANLILQACNDVLQTITSAINAITSYAKICLPLPNFSLNLDKNLFPTAPGCGGGVQINLLTTSYGAASNPPKYNYQQYLKQ